MIRMAFGTQSQARMLLWALLGAGVAFALAYAGFIAAAYPGDVSYAVGLWVYHGALVFASLTCLARAVLGSDQRVAWMAFGLGLLSWTAGDVYWTLVYSDAARFRTRRRPMPGSSPPCRASTWGSGC